LTWILIDGGGAMTRALYPGMIAGATDAI
jgi:hypothetical protein